MYPLTLKLANSTDINNQFMVIFCSTKKVRKVMSAFLETFQIFRLVCKRILRKLFLSTEILFILTPLGAYIRTGLQNE